MFEKLQLIEERYEEVNRRLMDPDVVSDQNAYRDLMKEYKSLTPIVEKFRAYKKTAADFEGLIKGAGGRAAQAVSGVDYAAAAHSHGMSDVSGLEAALGGKQPKKLLRAGAAVAASDWTDDAQGRYADYPKTALIAVEGAQESMLPEVIFSVADALSGNFAPAAVSVSGGVRIYAKEVPEGSVTVTAVLWA